jgi:uncharacterized protein YwqG
MKFKNLEAALQQPEQVTELELFCRLDAPQDAKRLQAFPSEILQFHNLRSLNLIGNRISELPEAIGGLQQLEELHLTGNPIKQLPPAVCDLRSLKWLNLNKTGLEALPDDIARLQQLRWLDLDDNRLQTLPAGIGQLAELRRLNLEGNPFTQLPATLNNLNASIRLHSKYKNLYRGDQYRTPAPEPALPPERFLAKGNTQLRQQAGRLLEQHELQLYTSLFEPLVKHCISLETTEKDDYSRKGNTRLGGVPDLPPDAEHPQTDGKLWIFLAQLNLEELAPLQDYLPRSGILYFFVTDTGEIEDHRVLYYNGAGALQTYRMPEPDGEYGGAPYWNDVFFDSQAEYLYEPYRVQASAIPSFPHFYGEDWIYEGTGAALQKLETDYDSEDAERFAALREELAVQEQHTINSFVFTQHESPEERAAAAKGGSPQEWICLLALEHDNKTGFCFWDAGTLYFMIHRNDLARADFSNIYVDLESS